jgi:dihydrolipoamide dehydrogenase
MEVVVVGAGPAGVAAAIRAAELGARTTLVTRDGFGGMAAHDGPVPVRTLAHAARLMRDARQLARYGIAVGMPRLDYAALLARVREVVGEVREHGALFDQAVRVGVTIHERAGSVRFVGPNTLESTSGLQLNADRIVLCTGGVSRRLSVPGAELAATHSDAWALTEVPASMIVVGGGMTGLQVASIFHAFGSRVQLMQAGPRILPAEDVDVSADMATALRNTGMTVREGFGAIDALEELPAGVRLHYSKDGVRAHQDAELVVATIGWAADTAGLNLTVAGVESNARGFIQVDDYLATSAPHVFAAGDVTGRNMIVPPALHDGIVAATNAVNGRSMPRKHDDDPIGSYTDPEYARVGLTEAEARKAHDAIVGVVRFDETARTIIDGHTGGFCKLIADRASRKILGCHIVGERAVDIVQVAAVAIAAGMRVDDLARVPLSFPTYAGILGRVAASAARRINPPVGWQVNETDC